MLVVCSQDRFALAWAHLKLRLALRLGGPIKEQRGRNSRLEEAPLLSHLTTF